MTTKDHCIYLPDKHKLISNGSSDNYSNFSLNKSHTCTPAFDRNSSKSAEIGKRRSSNYDVPQKTTSQKSNISLKKSYKNLSIINTNFNDGKEGAENFSSCNKSSSTLSLHIAAYENFVESQISDTFADKEFKKKATTFSASKNFIQQSAADSSFNDPFEFPRQQESSNESKKPEIQQFSASQKLFAPIQDTLAVGTSRAVVGGTIKVNNVNDFIMPNVKCVAGIPAPQSESTQIIRIHSTKKKEGDAPPPKPIKVTLSDCLSCTGCLTSSEELFKAQDVEEFRRGLESDSKIKVVTLSPQAIVSLAAKTGLTPEQVAVGASNFLKSIGVDYVIDSSIAREVTKAQIYEDFKKPNRSGPLVTGVCPGVVSFAEKNEPKTLMPQLSITRSPMLITGALVKDNLSKELGIKPSEIYHACVMPCFDKKLEAFRPDAKFPDGTQLVDCVVATVEFVTVMPEDLTPYLHPSNNELTWFNTLEHEIVQGTSGATTSGSYAEYIVAQMERDYPHVTCEQKKMYEGVEFNLSDKNSGFEKRIAVMNGYRNFQRAINQIKGGKSKYDFIELMACPSGCANGAGQIKAENPMEQKKLLEKVIGLYNALPENKDFYGAYTKALNEWKSINPDYSNFVYATYEAARVNDLIEAANAW